VNTPPDPERTPGLLLEVARGGTASTRVALDRSGAIQGTVIDDRGAPAGDVWVTVKPTLTAGDRGALRTLAMAQAQQRRVLSDADGRFLIDGLASDARFDVRALEPYGSSVVQPGKRPGESVELRLPQAAAISGIALDAQGRPLTQFYARAHSVEADSQQLRPVHAPDGRFSIPGVAPGAVQLSLVADNGLRAVAELSLAPGEHRTGLTLQLQSADEAIGSGGNAPHPNGPP
jgi:hypothetical protein